MLTWPRPRRSALSVGGESPAKRQSNLAAPLRRRLQRPSDSADALNLPEALRVVLAESEEQTLLRDVLQTDATVGGIVLAVGPEGGWTEEELQSFQQAGWISASLGNTILRAETAAIAAIAVVASTLFSF